VITIGEDKLGCPLCHGAQVDGKGRTCVGCGGHGYIAQIVTTRDEPSA
jgi:hypothetical protein